MTLFVFAINIYTAYYEFHLRHTKIRPSPTSDVKMGKIMKRPISATYFSGLTYIFLFQMVDDFELGQITQNYWLIYWPIKTILSQVSLYL